MAPSPSRCSAEIYRYQGSKIVGTWARPVATKPKFPAVLFLHGFPGSEKNVDIQRALLKKGVGAFQVHFRGAWGSEGKYRFSKLVDEARQAWKVMKGFEGVDRKRLGVFGFSMGGWTALHLSAKESDCRAVAAVAPVGGPEMLQPGAKDRIEYLSRPLQAPPLSVLYKDFADSLTKQDPAQSVAQRKCPMLLVQGGLDEIVPAPVVTRLYKLATGPKKLLHRADARHDFLEQRDWLTARVSGWLASKLK